MFQAVHSSTEYSVNNFYLAIQFFFGHLVFYLFSPLVFIYLVVQFWSNVPVSLQFHTSSSLSTSWGNSRGHLCSWKFQFCLDRCRKPLRVWNWWQECKVGAFRNDVTHLRKIKKLRHIFKFYHIITKIAIILFTCWMMLLSYCSPYPCFVYWPVFECCTLQTLFKICFLDVFRTFSQYFDAKSKNN